MLIDYNVRTCYYDILRISTYIIEKMAKKKNTMLLKLVSSEGTGYYFVRSRNPKKLTTKLKFRKFDPVARKHVIFDEKKLSS